MSGFLGRVGGALLGGTISNAINNAVLIIPTRSIGTMIPDCAVEERHHDRLVVTQHPVETGAQISDHAYKLPAEVHLRWAWSNSAAANLFGTEDYVKVIYNELQQLQLSGQTFELYTGKRYYPACLMTSLGIYTDEKSEYALLVDATVTEVIIARTQATSTPTQDQQTTPQQTAPQQNQGTQQAKPVPESILRSLGDTSLGQSVGRLFQ